MLIAPKQTPPKKRGRPRKNADPGKSYPLKEGKGDIGVRGNSSIRSTVYIPTPNTTNTTTTSRPEKIDFVIAKIDEGYDLHQIEKMPGMPSHQAIVQWMQKDNEAASRYARARERRADRLAREIMDIADNVDKRDPAAVNAARLQCDVRKWYLSKTMPEKYGENAQITLAAKPSTALALAGAAAIAEAQRLKNLLEAPAEVVDAEAVEVEATNPQ